MAARRYTDDPPEGYKQSRATLRERFGPRQIDASAPLAANDMTRTLIGTEPADERGFTPDKNWADFFRKGPVISPFYRGAQPNTIPSGLPLQQPMTAGTSPLGGQSPVAPMIQGVEVQQPLSQGLPLQQPLASTPPPTDFLKTALDNTHKFWNRMGANFSNAKGSRIPVPGTGQTQAGTSFTGGKYQTPGTVGSVASASQTALQRLMRDTSYI